MRGFTNPGMKSSSAGGGVKLPELWPVSRGSSAGHGHDLCMPGQPSSKTCCGTQIYLSTLGAVCNQNNESLKPLNVVLVRNLVFFRHLVPNAQKSHIQNPTRYPIMFEDFPDFWEPPQEGGNRILAPEGQFQRDAKCADSGNKSSKGITCFNYLLLVLLQPRVAIEVLRGPRQLGVTALDMLERTGAAPRPTTIPASASGSSKSGETSFTMS